MAVMNITDTDIAGALKNVYASFRVNAFPKLTPLLAQVKKGSPGGPESMKWGGNGVFWDVVLTRPTGMTAEQTGFFGPHSQATEKQATLGIKRTYVTRQIDSLAVQGTSEGNASFVPFARKIVQEAMDAATLGQQEVLHGDGRAIKGILVSTADSTHVVVTDPYGITGAGQGGLLLDVGMFVAVLDTSAADAVLGVTAITSAINTGDNVALIFATAVTGAGMAAGDKIVPASTLAKNAFNAYPNGLTNILNRGAGYNLFEGLTAATDARWDATRVVATDPAQPNELDVWQLATQIAGKSGKDAKQKPGQFLLMSTPGIEKKLAESFLGQRRWDAESRVTLKGGFAAINLMGLALVSDYWCPSGTVYLLHLPSLTWVDRQDWVKLSFEGSGPWRFISGQDAYEVNFGSYWNFGALQRNPHGMITGFTDLTRFSHVM